MTPIRRGRLTIAALLLLVLGGGLWSTTRPKIDPRLVGTWSIDGNFPAGLFETEFRADGTTETDDDLPLLPGQRYEWRVVGGYLLMNFLEPSKPPPNLFQSWYENLTFQVHLWWHAIPIAKQHQFSAIAIEAYEVVVVTRDSVRLRNLDDVDEADGFVTLERLPPGRSMQKAFPAKQR